MTEKSEVLDLPIKVTELIMTNLKKNTELSLNFFQEIEKNQREFFKGSYDLMNIALPFEGNIWEMQTKMIDKTMNIIDETYEKMKSVLNK
jgi:hypothetical protein